MRVALTLLLAFVACDVSWAQANKPMPVPTVETVAEGVIWRESATENHGPPWKEITITNIFGFKKRPVVGRAVTVVTLGSDISPLSLHIRSAKLIDDPCDARLRRWWEVELEPLTLKKFFDVPPPPDRNAEYPFDVVIIYPAVKVARQVKKDQLKRETLPKGIAIDTVKAAIDLNDDGSPEVLVLKYCCTDPKKPPNACDYTCGKTFKKVRNAWKLVDTSAPC